MKKVRQSAPERQRNEGKCHDGVEINPERSHGPALGVAAIRLDGGDRTADGNDDKRRSDFDSGTGNGIDEVKDVFTLNGFKVSVSYYPVI